MQILKYKYIMLCGLVIKIMLIDDQVQVKFFKLIINCLVDSFLNLRTIKY